MSGEASSARMIGTLTVAGLASGLLLVGVYEVTLPIIEANKAAALERAVFEVLPGTAAMQPLVLRDGTLALADGSEEEPPSVFFGRDEAGAPTGYAIRWQGTGFQDVISLIYGYDPARGLVVGMEILTSKETPGLGDKIFKDTAFVANFDALSVTPEIVPVPNGTKGADNEVDCITGATISSKAVVKIINAGNDQWLGLLPEGDPWGEAADAVPEQVPVGVMDGPQDEPEPAAPAPAEEATP
jgi:Na+-translocating ferredoxin:NAD+ oxidoreductase subunit G